MVISGHFYFSRGLKDSSDWRVYVILISISGWIVRRVTHQSWLGSGWPQWVVLNNDAIDGDQFDTDINRMQSIAYFTLVGANILPGLMVDFTTKKYATKESPLAGRAFGLSICFTVAGSFLIAQERVKMPFKLLYNLW